MTMQLGLALVLMNALLPGPLDLRTDYRVDPLGIDEPRPRLSWRLPATAQCGARQTACRLLVASSEALLARDEADLWDSGRLDGERSIQVPYAGRPLTSRARCWWKVKVWDQAGAESAWSAPASWTMGLLEAGDWQARWIGSANVSADPAASQLMGYHAAESRNPDEIKWVQVDLGAGRAFDELRLYPPPPDAEHVAGFGFPVRFRVETADEAAFARPRLLFDGTATDQPNPGNAPRALLAAGAHGRYVRVSATRLWNRGTGPQPFCFALASLVVLAGGKDLALGAPVTAKDSVEAFGWGRARLTAGPPAAAPTTAGRSGLPLFRKAFTIDKPVRRAELFICGLGCAEVRLNGKLADEAVFEPGWTVYSKTCLYRVLDLTERLVQGENVLGVLLGNGMYNVQGGRYTKFKGSFGPPRLLAQLHLDYADGTHDVVASDASWRTAPGPLTFSCVYGGEDYDARAEQPGWDAPGFAVTAAWKPVTVTTGPGGKLIGASQSAPPVTAHQLLPTVARTRLRPGVWLYDLGQNCSLQPLLTVKGPAGAKVSIVTGERWDGAKFVGACDRLMSFNYVLRGGAPETWAPRFCYCGARYLQIEGAEPDGETNDGQLPVLLKVEGRFVCSSAASAGEFACSNELFNRTFALIGWAMRSNMMSILTDCPHREKLGWLEQVHLVGPSLMYGYDLATLLTKMCGDMADSQRDNGLMPDIAPEYVKFSGGFVDSPEWGSACVLVPWQVYQWYGDLDILRRHYPMMQRYVAYLDGKAKDHLLSHGLADWYALDRTSATATATAFYYADAAILTKVARLLDKPDDAAHYAALAAEIRAAYNAKLLKQGSYGSQTANALPLALGLTPPADAPAVLDAIVADIRRRGNALTSGDVGYRYLLRALADHGRSDVICDMNSRTDKPGYAMILAKGATSLTEPWDGGPSASSNHFMLGHIMEWFFADLAGIQADPAEPGWRRIVIKPQVVGDLTWVKAHYDCPYGRVASAWRKAEGRLTLDVQVPPNTTATIHVPARDAAGVTEGGRPAAAAAGVRLLRADTGVVVFELGSGVYHFAGELP